MEQLDIYYLSICFIQVRCTAAPAVAAERMCWYLFDTVFDLWEEYTPQRHGKKKPDLAKKKRMRVCTCILEICYNLVSLQSTV